MPIEYKVTFSIVVYKQPIDELKSVVNSILLYTSPARLYIIDNSPTDEARILCEMNSCIEYQHIPENIGFGKAHNIAMKQAEAVGSEYHFIVNPDISYTKDVVAPMVEWLDKNPSVGQMMPKILNLDGTTQFLPKLMPSPQMLLWRRLRNIAPNFHNRKMQTFEMRKMRDDRVYDVGHVSGCFSVVRVDVLRKCGLYDERFFMYFEDTDLTRRIRQNGYRTVFFPFASVFHDYGHGAAHNYKLFITFLSSFFKFFCKWGWIFDSKRRYYNKSFLGQLE